MEPSLERCPSLLSSQSVPTDHFPTLSVERLVFPNYCLHNLAVSTWQTILSAHLEWSADIFGGEILDRFERVLTEGTVLDSVYALKWFLRFDHSTAQKSDAELEYVSAVYENYWLAPCLRLLSIHNPAVRSLVWEFVAALLEARLQADLKPAEVYSAFHAELVRDLRLEVNLHAIYRILMCTQLRELPLEMRMPIEANPLDDKSKRRILQLERAIQ